MNKFFKKVIFISGLSILSFSSATSRAGKLIIHTQEEMLDPETGQKKMVDISKEEIITSQKNKHFFAYDRRLRIKVDGYSNDYQIFVTDQGRGGNSFLLPDNVSALPIEILNKIKARLEAGETVEIEVKSVWPHNLLLGAKFADDKVAGELDAQVTGEVDPQPGHVE